MSSGHRSLVIGFLNGRLPKTYRQKDYEQLNLAIAQASNESKRSERKLDSLEQQNQAAIEFQFDAMHKRVWSKEWERLCSFRSRFQRDLDEYLQLTSLTFPRGDEILEIVDQQDELDESIQQFLQFTSKPIEDFCEDIQYWVNNKRRDYRLAQDPERIVEALKSIKEQQIELLDMMESEQNLLEKMVKIRSVDDDLHDEEIDMDDDYISTARSTMSVTFPNCLPIPEDIFYDQKCDLTLKENLLQQYISLDDHYYHSLMEINHKMMDAKSSVLDIEHKMAKPPTLLHYVVNDENPVELSTVDSWKISTLEAVYRRAPTDMPKKWYTLFIHFIGLMYPTLQRWQLSKYSTALHRYLALKRRLNIVLKDWKRSHIELSNRIRLALEKSGEELQEEYQRIVDHAEQRALCEKLTAEVERWRKLKLQEQLLKQEIDAAKELAEAEHLAALLEQEKEEKRLKKEKIQAFKDEKQRKREEVAKEKERLLKEVQEKLLEQSKIDWERINFRKELYDEKIHEQEEKKRELELDEERKEERLEELRKKVRVEAKSDLVRTMGDTDAWRKRDERYLRMVRNETNENDVEWWQESKPLFNTVGFSSKQILNDKRLQLEQKLRETGLIASEYGRQLVAQMKAPTVTRRDQIGTLGTGDLLPPPRAPRPINYFQPNR